MSDYPYYIDDEDEEALAHDSKYAESTALFNSMLEGLDQKSPREIMKVIRDCLEVIGDGPDIPAED